MRPLTIFFAFSLLLSSLSAENIEWETNYEKAVTTCAENGKSMIVLFTGSDWCGWCQKLEKEVFGDDAFCKTVGDKFVFMKADFPVTAPQNDAEKKQNALLQEAFQVEGFPTLVILDEKQQKIGTAGYQAGGGKNYAKYLLRVIRDYSEYKNSLDKIAQQRLSATELEQLYRKARELGQKDDIDNILAAGMISDNPTAFLLERYRLLAEANQSTSKEAQNIREYLVNSDPENDNGVHYRLAIIDFQRKAEGLEKGQGTAKEACSPLTGYLAKFGKKDPTNLWRLNMTIAQTHQGQGDLEQALKYARASERTAPAQVKELVAETVRALEAAGNGSNVASIDDAEGSARG